MYEVLSLDDTILACVHCCDQEHTHKWFHTLKNSNNKYNIKMAYSLDESIYLFIYTQELTETFSKNHNKSSRRGET